MLSPEIADEIKKQLLIEIEKLPNENKEQLKNYIKSLNEKELEEFLEKNRIQVKTNVASEKNQCIFCRIAKREIPSYKIAENKKAVAVLEINPFSKGHSIVIPFEHTTIEKIPKTVLSLSQKIAKKIKKKLKPNDIKIETVSSPHPIINVIPIYENIPLKKYRATEEELKKIQSKLETKKRTKRKKQEKESSEPLDLKELSFRIP